MKTNKMVLAVLLSMVALPAMSFAKSRDTHSVASPTQSKNPIVRLFHHQGGQKK